MQIMQLFPCCILFVQFLLLDIAESVSELIWRRHRAVANCDKLWSRQEVSTAWNLQSFFFSSSFFGLIYSTCFSSLRIVVLSCFLLFIWKNMCAFTVHISYFGETVFYVIWGIICIDGLIKYLLTCHLHRNVCASRHLWKWKHKHYWKIYYFSVV